MRAVRLHAPGDVRLHEEPRPQPGEGEALVQVTSVGLCGSDLHWFTEGGIGDARLSRPLVLGHEMAGVIRGGPDDGRRVAIDPAIPCGRCDLCRTDRGNLCPDIAFAGHGRIDGGLREFMAWPSAQLHTLPDNVSDDGGALLEPLGVALHALRLGHVHLGMTAGVVGLGPIGLMLVQVVRLAGATRVLAVEPLAHRLTAGMKLGVEPIDPADAGGEQAAAERADVVFEMGGTDAAVDTALRMARPGARVVLAGIPDDDRTRFSASLARRKGLTLVLVRRMHETYPRAIDLAARGLVSLEPLVSETFPLERAADAMSRAAARTGLKTLIRPGPTPPHHPHGTNSDTH